MAQIALRNVTKRYQKIVALNGIGFEVRDKEFFVLFGPAGAGKTTVLKIISGIEYPDTGTVTIDGVVVNRIEPAQRNVSMVFENYALYPHLSAYDNIASPLRSPLYKQDARWIDQRVRRVASILKIDRLLHRLPSQLSNGQKQRVAIGRSLVRAPNVFLLDEPLAHLDAKLRHLMRAELKEMQTTLDTTTIYVTHDYLEAMSLGDRIGVLNQGHIEQIGTADDVYYTPANQFVARLFGEPEINILPVELARQNGRLQMQLFGQYYHLPTTANGIGDLAGERPKKFNLGIRPNAIRHAFDRLDSAYIGGTVYSYEPIGNKSILIAKVNHSQIRITTSNDLSVPLDSEIFIKIDLENAILFDPADESFIARMTPDFNLERVLKLI